MIYLDVHILYVKLHYLSKLWTVSPLHCIVKSQGVHNAWVTHGIHAINSYSASRDNWCTVGGDGGCRVGEVRAGTISPMPDHKGFKLQ